MAENITTILDKAELPDSQASDKFYVMRGTGSDRDRNSTLATILAGAPFSAATRGLRDENAQWKVFTPANGAIDTGTWAQNSIVQMQAWEDTITNVGATIKNAVMILIPRWGTVGTAATATSCTFQHAFSGAPDITITIPAGNIAVISFGSSGGVQEYHCIPSSNSKITAAIFKTLSVGGNATVGGNISSGGTIKAQEGTGAVPYTSMDKSGISVTDGATNTTEISDDEVSISNSSSSVSLKTTGLAFASAGSTDSGTYSSNMQNESGEYKHVSSGTSTSGVETTTTDTLSFTPESIIAL